MKQFVIIANYNVNITNVSSESEARHQDSLGPGLYEVSRDWAKENPGVAFMYACAGASVYVVPVYIGSQSGCDPNDNILEMYGHGVEATWENMQPPWQEEDPSHCDDVGSGIIAIPIVINALFLLAALIGNAHGRRR